MPSPTAAKKEVTLPRLTLNGERVYLPAAYDLLRQVLRGDGRVPA